MIPHKILLSREPRLKTTIIAPIERLSEHPYASVLCFPKPTEAALQTRIEELRALGVSALEFSGESNVFGVSLRVLGKGFVGVVVIAQHNGKRLAAKIRRVDADRADLLHEAEMLKLANSVGASPKLVAASRNFLLMQLIEGELLPRWLKNHREASLARRVLRSLLEACFRMDKIGLDHGELSKAPKHIIIDHDMRPWIVDFETASAKRKPANLPAICHFLFTSPGEVAQTVAAILGERDKEKIVETLHEYKSHMCAEMFEKVAHACLNGDFS